LYVAVEICMILACVVGFYIFYINERPVVMESSALLDEVLLLICILGPLVSSLLAVIAGTDNKTDERWVMTLIYPICDTFQCLLQVVLILFGLQREPETTDLAKETVEEIKKSFQEANQCSDVEDLEPGNEMQHIAHTYLRSHHNSINYVLSALFHQQPPTNNETSQTNPLTRVPSRISIPRNVDIGEDVSVDSPNSEHPLPQITANGIVAENAESQLENNSDENESNRKSIIKIVSQSKVSHPRGGRLVLRDVSMFLLITNACLWMYMSLDGTAFTTHLYQHHFFGASVWTTILMICRPLSIFFRMHSAGCLLEIWSFA
ncbi:proton channel OTOP1-like, partial [Ciona intestinalis]